MLGKGYGEAVAMEGALKLKEMTYIHAEGYSGGALKHGPFALIDGPEVNSAFPTQRARGLRHLLYRRTSVLLQFLGHQMVAPRRLSSTARPIMVFSMRVLSIQVLLFFFILCMRFLCTSPNRTKISSGNNFLHLD